MPDAEMNHADIPLEIRVNRERDALAMTWADGSTDRLAARGLRAGCRCSACVAAKHRAGRLQTIAETRIVAVEAIGAYAINIRFSDGHARGIFPWAYLRELASAA